MQVVCEATQSAEPTVQVAALQCLIEVMSLYYDKMAAYMTAALWQVCGALLRIRLVPDSFVYVCRLPIMR